MNTKKFLVCALTMLIVSACSTTPKGVIKSRYYIENDGTGHYLRLQYGAYSLQHAKPGTQMGVAYTNDGIRVPIYASDTPEKQFGILNLDKNNEMVILDEPSRNDAVQSSKNLKLYEFDDRIFETIIYSSPNGVCHAHKNHQPIQARSVTNYYNAYKNGKGNLGVIIIHSTINGEFDYQIKDFEIKAYNQHGEITMDNLSEKEIKELKQQVEKTQVIPDVRKQTQLIRTLLCSFQAA